jgi:hypothetical protein
MRDKRRRMHVDLASSRREVRRWPKAEVLGFGVSILRLLLHLVCFRLLVECNWTILRGGPEAWARPWQRSSLKTEIDPCPEGATP